jgi:hypothetical protein
MDLSIYKTLIDFEEYYLDEWEKSTELSRLEFLRKYQIEYKKEFGENLKKLTEYSSKIFYLANNYNFMISKIGLTNQMSPLMINHYGIIINQIVNELRAKKNIPKDLKDVISKDIKDYFNYCKELESYQKNNSNYESILNLIAVKIDNEKQNFLKYGRQQPNQTQQEESEPLTAKQQQKVGLLIRSGFIDFLRDKNPGISNNKISGFIELLTTEPMKKTSINPHLVDSTDNVKHPFYSRDSLNDIDLILKKFGISPQSEQ